MFMLGFYVFMMLFQTGAPATPSANDTNIFLSQVTWGAVMAYILLLLQRWSKLPWLTQHTTEITTIFRAVLAFVATIGIGISWNGAAHTLTITNLSLSVIASGLWHWFGQFAIQHGWGQLFLLQPQQKQQ